jgi:hypothetical protein
MHYKEASDAAGVTDECVVAPCAALEEDRVEILCQPGFARLTKSESIGISHHSCWTGCAVRCKRGSQERPKSLFFAASWDINGLRGQLRGPIVFADLRSLRAFCPKAFGL